MRASAKYIWIFIVVAFVGGFLLLETSGLMTRGQITPTTAVAKVNGEDILATTWYQTTQNLEQQATQRGGRSITLDERQRLQDEAFDQLVADALLRQEYKRRGIKVSDQEILDAAKFNPPPQLMQAPDLQTEGRFDPEKYQRFLASPMAKQEGLLMQLEQYYRNEIPKEKLFDQVVSDIYLSDAQLWTRYKDARDSARISFVLFAPDRLPDSAVRVTDDEIRAYYDTHKKEFDRPGRARVSILTIPRTVGPADSAATRSVAAGLKARIIGGEKFEDVARAESADSASAANGGSLGKGPKGRFVPAFEAAAYALSPGQISDPVLTPFGYHIIKLDERKGDTLSLRHILLRIQQSDSAAVRTDRKADSLSLIAASAEEPQKFDQAARTLNLPILRTEAIEGNSVTISGKFIPSVGPWAFKGARPGETSELFDAEDGYYIARLDSLWPAGALSLDQAKGDIRTFLVRKKKVDQLVTPANNFAKVAAAGTLETASQLMGMKIVTPAVFTRVSGAPELTGLPEIVGASFSLPLDQISAPLKTEGGIAIIRVEERTPASRAVFDAQKDAQRQAETQQLRQQRVREFLGNLRQAAKIDDRRKSVESSSRSVQ
ncbi:MAG TPA: peptidyl-prolyl cis-trans isomerase [Gemmatimonadaceae bacterium]|nr:peptidyl-prolyl cis-trans isomerase [Gemmatimonadaceae bacterium]